MINEENWTWGQRMTTMVKGTEGKIWWLGLQKSWSLWGRKGGTLVKKMHSGTRPVGKNLAITERTTGYLVCTVDKQEFPLNQEGKKKN